MPMRIFTYGIEDIKMDAVRWRFGKADYIDVTPQYQDRLALCADIVLVAIDHTPEDVLSTIKEYQEEVADDDVTKYIYITDAQINTWIKELFIAMEDSINMISEQMSADEFEALHLFALQKYHGGIITHVETEEDGNLKHYEFYRPEVGKREILIISLGENIIDAATYHSYEKDYDIVSVACYREKQGKSTCIREMFESRTSQNDLPSVLWKIKSKLDKAVKPYMYAYFGE